MKNIFKYSSFLLLTLFLATSCDDTSIGDDEELNYNTGINVVQFPSVTTTAPAVADGDPKSYDIKIMAAGPDLVNINGDAVVSFSVDPSSTAVAGVNYNLNSSTVTLTKDAGFLATVPLEIITTGITPPTQKTLVLNIDSVSGTGANLVTSGNKSQVVINISYSCFADLAGTYSVTNDFCNPTGRTIDIEGNADGSWSLESGDGLWLDTCTGNAGNPNAGSIFVICGEVEVAIPNENCAAQDIACLVDGTWDADTGTLILNIQDNFFSGGPFDIVATYVRQ